MEERERKGKEKGEGERDLHCGLRIQVAWFFTLPAPYPQCVNLLHFFPLAP